MLLVPGNVKNIIDRLIDSSNMRFDYIGKYNHVDNYLKEILALVYYGLIVNNRSKLNRNMCKHGPNNSAD